MSHTPHHTLLDTLDPQPISLSEPTRGMLCESLWQTSWLVSHQADSWGHHEGHFVGDKERKLVAQAFPTASGLHNHDIFLLQDGSSNYQGLKLCSGNFMPKLNNHDTTLPLPCTILNLNQRAKNRGGLQLRSQEYGVSNLCQHFMGQETVKFFLNTNGKFSVCGGTHFSLMGNIWK